MLLPCFLMGPNQSTMHYIMNNKQICTVYHIIPFDRLHVRPPAGVLFSFRTTPSFILAGKLSSFTAQLYHAPRFSRALLWRVFSRSCFFIFYLKNQFFQKYFNTFFKKSKNKNHLPLKEFFSVLNNFNVLILKIIFKK